MKNNICLVFGAGDYFKPPPEHCNERYIIAADGGYDYLKKNGIEPNLTVGDFDSCTATPNCVNSVVLPQEKDSTDMYEAITIGYEKGFRVFHIYGGTGGRIDHTFANIQCLAELAAKGARGYLFDKANIITAISGGSIYFDEKSSGYISVFAHSDTAVGVWEKGFKYPLENATLYNTFPLGVSNEFIGMPCSISVDKGILVVVYGEHVREVLT